MSLVVFVWFMSVCPSIWLLEKWRTDLHELYYQSNNRLDFGDDPFKIRIYDPDPIRILQIFMKLLPKVYLRPMTNPLNLGMI